MTIMPARSIPKLSIMSVLVVALMSVGASPIVTPASADARSPDEVEARNGKLLFEAWTGWHSCYALREECLSSTTPNYDIWSVNPDGTGLTNLTHAPGIDTDGQWSPDGSKIVFGSNRNGSNYDIFVMDADGSDLQQLTDTPAAIETYATWSPNGRRIAYVDNSRRAWDIVIMTADGTPRRRIRTFSDVWGLAWSPDGRHIAFTRIRETGEPPPKDYDVNVYLMRRDGTGVRRLTSRYKGLWSEDANWSPDGRRLVFDGGFDREVCKRPGCDRWSIFTIRRDGRGLRRIASNPTHVFAPEWSPDGTTIAYTTDDGDPASWGDIWFVDPDGENKRQAIIKPDSYDYEVDWQAVPSQ